VLERGWVEVGGDCDDTNSSVRPNNAEECDNVDNDCDGDIDEDLVLATHYLDLDRDGYGDLDTAETGCAVPVGRVTAGGDCDDINAGINPAAVELCDGLDQNCNEATDEGLTRAMFVDGDGDTWGGAEVPACDGAEGFAERGGDCDDSDPEVLPGGVEVCDGNDDNCNGAVDEFLTSTFFLDADSDGFGNAAIPLDACAQPAGYVVDSSDCDDLEGANFPGNVELCDYTDNDCDLAVDEGIDNVWYADVDADGLGDPWTRLETCTPPATHIQEVGDCDDSDAAIPPNCPTTLYGQWGGIGGDNRRSGYAQGTVGIGTLSLAWSVNLAGAVDPVAIADGKVFATPGASSDPDTRIVALDLGNGSELWSVDGASLDWMSGPTWSDGQVCLTRADLGLGNVSCLDAETGVENWVGSIVSGSASPYMAPIVYEGRVYSGAGTSGTLYGHTFLSGNESFATVLSSPSGWGAAAYNDTIWVWEGAPAQLHGVNATTGLDVVTIPALTYPTFSSTVGNTVVIGEDGVGYLTGTTSLAAYTLSTRALKFTTTGIVLNGFPAVRAGELYGVKTDGTLAAWNAATGVLIRSYLGATGLVGPPVVTDDAVIAASTTTTYVFDIDTGTLLQSIPHGGSLAVGENHLVLADSAGNVRGYSW
jgi:Putative metal-binding motif/PQQ-like domain